jgi:hypothetical protein
MKERNMHGFHCWDLRFGEASLACGWPELHVLYYFV